MKPHYCDRRQFLHACGTAALLAAACGHSRAETAAQPNFIFFLTDDISRNDLGCYGHPTIKTPNLDRMAGEGLIFNNAYLTVSSCSPSRCSMITGRYPHNTGAPELHTELPTDQYLFPESLRQAGYYTVLAGKNHMGDVRRGFDVISNNKRADTKGGWVELLRDRPKDKPFFCWFASSDAHRGWQFDDTAPRYSTEDAQVPPYLYDGPETREDLASYYHEVSRTDYYAGLLRAELERQGVAENTYLVYCSDNGRPFPRTKTRLYDDSIMTPLIIWAPGRVKPGVSDSLVSSIDFAPTFLELAGLQVPPPVQGVSMTPILKDPEAETREYVFAEHNWHVFQAHERMVRWKDFLYIRNAWPERQNLCKESTAAYPAGKELWEMEAAGKLNEDQRDVFLKPRPPEELYHISTDPDQLHNLVNDAAYQPQLEKLRKLLDQWTEETGDTVQEHPTGDREDPEGNKLPDFKVGEFPGAARHAETINLPGPVRED